jgi:hypothetical protein
MIRFTISGRRCSPRWRIRGKSRKNIISQGVGSYRQLIATLDMSLFYENRLSGTTSAQSNINLLLWGLALDSVYSYAGFCV